MPTFSPFSSVPSSLPSSLPPSSRHHRVSTIPHRYPAFFLQRDRLPYYSFPPSSPYSPSSSSQPVPTSPVPPSTLLPSYPPALPPPFPLLLFSSSAPPSLLPFSHSPFSRLTSLLF
ncbi:unnamed protein product [Closterium sp. NIES-54]